MTTNDTIATFLWFEQGADEAARQYCAIVPGARLIEASPASATFELRGQRFIAFNGGPHHKLTPAVSIFIACETQAEIDELWTRFLAAGATESRCGWLTDRFGLSWQIIPRALPSLIGDPDPARARRALDAMMTMRKLDLAALQRAHAGDA